MRKRWLLWALLPWWAAVATWQTLKPMPPGTDLRTGASYVAAAEAQFLSDLTSVDPGGRARHEQQIFDEVLRIIDEAHSFIVADFFLLNDQMGAAHAAHRALSSELIAHLLARKATRPGLSILLVTDPINEIYGGAQSAQLEALRRGGIEVVTTDLSMLRDPNPVYSALWRMFVQWWGNDAGGGVLPNPFTSSGEGITLRSWLALLNFKANHRKLIVADRVDGELVALVTSANPHDASSGHSNVALRFTGELGAQLAASELAIARESGWRGHIELPASTARASTVNESPEGTAQVGPAGPSATGAPGDPAVRLSFLTEQAIRDQLLDALAGARAGDRVRMAVFYLSDRLVIEALLDAAARGAHLRLILDPNRDAFGLRKDGVPNRPVAHELVTRSQGRIEVRWYRTHGEQFHSKIALIERDDRLIATLGSANYTRRNLGNYNLEANVAADTLADSKLAMQMIAWFDRLWNNDGPPGTQYTAAYEAWRDADRLRYWRYRLMEATGLSTF